MLNNTKVKKKENNFIVNKIIQNVTKEDVVAIATKKIITLNVFKKENQ